MNAYTNGEKHIENDEEINIGGQRFWKISRWFANKEWNRNIEKRKNEE